MPVIIASFLVDR